MEIIYQDICSKIYSLEQTREIEKKAIQSLGDDFALMKRAGKFCFQCIQYHLKEQFSKQEIKKIVVFCGKGNNGGDGYIVAALAKGSGIEDVICVEVGDFTEQKATARKAKRIAKEKGIKIQKSSLLNDDFFISLKNKDCIVVDALLGTGAKRIVSKDLKSIILLINKFAHFVASIDIPSGVCTDKGIFNNIFINASITISLVTLKTGLMISREFCGKIYFSDLKVSKEILNSLQPEYFLLPPKNVIDFFPERNSNSHKGDFGHLLIIGGNTGMAGSVILAAEAALKSGLGKVTVATKKENFPALLSRVPETMTLELDNLKNKNWKKILEDKEAVVIGPGLGKDEWAEEICHKVFSNEIKKVIDADSLHFLAESYRKKSRKKSIIKKKIPIENFVLTPHPKEASILLEEDVQFIQENRKEAIFLLNNKYNKSYNHATFVLKGNKSLILGKTDIPFINVSGNPGMATAGSGDVLSGIIGSLLAQGFSTENAAIVGVNLHGQAGDQAKELYGESSLTATNISENIYSVIKNQKNNKKII